MISALTDTLVSFFNFLRGRSIVGFAMVGITSTILDVGTLNILVWLGANIYLATAIGFGIGATNGYILNSLFVFKQDRSGARFGKYVFVSLIGLLLTELIIHAIHVRSDMSVNLAKLIAVGIVFFWNYGWSKIWTFK